MKVAVLAANGKSGSLIVKEALEKGLLVSAFVREKSENVPSGARLIKKDIFALESKDLAEFDAVVDAFGEWENLELHEKHMKHLAKLFETLPNTRLLVVGGAGSLFMDKEHKTKLMDIPEFPSEYMGVARATASALEILRNENFNWTYLCPAAEFVFEDAKTGYILGGEEFFVNSKGQSRGSYADYAEAMVDLILKGGHKKERLSVISK